jgi:DNA polymerase III sliding clamp (beta) subunit (PCNA family)
VKLKVNVSNLTELCSQTSQTLDRQSHTPLGQVYLRAKKDQGSGWLFGYSNNLSAETLIKIPAEVEEEGEVLVHPARIIDFLMGRPKDDQINISLNDTRLRLQYKRSRADIAQSPETKHLSALLKKMPFGNKPAFTFKGADLAEFVRRGLFCIPQDDTGSSPHIVGGMYFTTWEDGYEAQATDGCIAAQIKVTAKKEGVMNNFMIPMASLEPLQRLVGKRRDEDIALVPGEAGSYGINTMYFRFGDVMFGTRLLHKQFPTLKATVDQAKAEVYFTVDREELKSALSRCSAFANRSRTLKIELKKDSLDLKVMGDEELQDSVQIADVTEPDSGLKMGVGLDYLMNIAGRSHAERLSFGMAGPLKPLIITDSSGEKVSSKYVMMGVKV